MNYNIDVEKLIKFIELSKGQPHAFPSDVLAKVQLAPTNAHSSNYDEPVLRKMFNGLVYMALYNAYIFHSDNGINKVDAWIADLREQIKKGGVPTAYGIINYAVYKHKESANTEVSLWYGELLLPKY